MYQLSAVDPDAAETAAPPRRRPVPVRLVVVAALAGSVTATWTVAALLTAGHGFDITDEGFYLLSYRWWQVSHRTFTGVQYVFGPVFEILGYDIAALRIVRLVLVLAAHAGFGWAFVRWLRGRRPAAPATRWWDAAGVLVITAAGGATFGWLPLTPGYNDVVLLGALTGAALVLRMATHAESGRTVPVRLPAALGVLAVPVLLTKWAVLPMVAVLGLAALGAVAPGRWRAALRVAVAVVAGAAAAALFVHVAVVRLDVALPPMLAVNRLLAADSMSLGTLLAFYRTSSESALGATIRQYGLLPVAGIVAALGPGRVARVAAGLAGAAGVVLAVGHAIRDDAVAGGAVNVGASVVALLVVPLFALLTMAAGALRGREWGESARTWVLLAVLALLPLLHAVGSGNAPFKVAVDAFAIWVALLVAVVTSPATPVVARALTGAVTALAVLAATSIAIGGLWRHPYRSAARAQTTAVAAGVPALASVRVDPDQAARYAALRGALRPYLSPPGRAVIGFDKMAGIVLVLDGRPVGEPWTSPADPARTAAGIASACPGGRPWWGDRAPIVLFNRPMRPADGRALAACHLDPAGYRAVPVAGLTALVPR